MIARTDEQTDEAWDRLSRTRAIGCDTETSGLSARSGRIFSVQFSDGDFSCLVPISEGARLGRLEMLLADPSVVKVFHNARFDLEFLCEHGVETNNVFCTMIAEKVLTRGANQSASLAETLYRYFAVDLDKSQRAKFNRKWDGIWTDELVDYALSDVVHLPKLMEEQTQWLERLGLRNEFEAHLGKIVRV
ncbi:MAG: ribonuclease D [Acidobacteria bacterium]|nr:ribonuclease D [Acidobacteriota bacterium]